MIYKEAQWVGEYFYREEEMQEFVGVVRQARRKERKLDKADVRSEFSTSEVLLWPTVPPFYY